MAAPDIIVAIDQSELPDALDDAIESVAAPLLDSGCCDLRNVKNFLHGTWLGHPLHPVLTDVPLGAWTVALALDALDVVDGGDTHARGADAAVTIGLAGAVASAVTGLTDWRHTDGRARRVGAVHATLNITATALYVASLVMRRRGSRGAGRALGALGFATVSASAYLGGHLVYGEQIGVDHTAEQTAPEAFVPVLAEAELPPDGLRRVETEEMPVLLARVGSQIYALSDTCTHLGCSLSEGSLDGCSIRCKCHGSEFSLETGEVLNGPATFPAPCLETRVRDGQIEVRGCPD